MNENLIEILNCWARDVGFILGDIIEVKKEWWYMLVGKIFLNLSYVKVSGVWIKWFFIGYFILFL